MKEMTEPTDRVHWRLGDPEHVCTVPALRSPPDEETLLRIAAIYDRVKRPLTAAEVLWCLEAEGTA